MLNYVEYLNMPFEIAVIIIGIFFMMQIIGEILEFKGKVVPEFFKIRKYFVRRKEEKNKFAKTLKDVEQLLNDVNAHYSADNIAKRNEWMQWVNDRADLYDKSIGQLNKTFSNVTQALKDNTKMTEEMFIQNSRDRIIDFAAKVSNENSVVSREEFNRIFKVYDRYEEFLEERELTNGEVDVAHQIIVESYQDHMKNHTFIEDIRGYSV